MTVQKIPFSAAQSEFTGKALPVYRSGLARLLRGGGSGAHPLR